MPDILNQPNPDLEAEYVKGKELASNMSEESQFQQLVQEAKKSKITPPEKTSDAKETAQPQQQTPSFMSDFIAPILQKIGMGSVATPETALTLATGAAAWPIAKAGGMMTLPFWGGEKSQAFEDYLSQMYTWQPHQEEAKQAAQTAGKVMGIPFKPSEWLGDLATKVTGSPTFGYGIKNVGEIATALLIPKITKGVKERFTIRDKTGPEVPDQTENTGAKTIDEIRGIYNRRTPEENMSEIQRRAHADRQAEYDKMAPISQRAHDEIQAAYDAIPKEEWDQTENTGAKTIDEIRGIYNRRTPEENMSEIQRRAHADRQAEYDKMAPISQRANDEIQAAYDAIPKEEWDKIWQDKKLKSIRDIADAVEEAGATTNAERLRKVADEADKSGADIQVIPGTLKPRPTVDGPNLRPAIKIGNRTIIGQEGETHPDILKRENIPADAPHERLFAKEDDSTVDREGGKTYMRDEQPRAYQNLIKEVGLGKDLHSEDYNRAIGKGPLPPEMAEEAAQRVRTNKVAEAWSKPGAMRTAEDMRLLRESSGVLGPEDIHRTPGDIARDLKTIFTLDERGGSGTWRPEQAAAADRLKKDFSTIAKNAARVGKSAGQYLSDMGFDRETVAYLAQGVQQQAQKETPLPPAPDIENVRVNLDRVANTESVKNIIADIDLKQQATGKIAETTRGQRAHETTIAAAKKVKMSVMDVLTRKPGEVWNAEQMTAARDIRDAAVESLKDLTDRASRGDEKAINDLPSVLTLVGELHAQDVGAGAEVARSLESRKILSDATRRVPFDVGKLAELAGAVKDSGGDPRLLVKRIKALETNDEKITFARQLTQGLKTTKDIFLYAWINGLLSNPLTQTKVFFSNLATFATGIMERGIGYGIGKAGEILGREPGQSFNESGALVEGAITGFGDALHTFTKVWKEDRPEFGKGRSLEINPNPLAMENLGTSGAWGKTLEWMGTVIGSPGRTLMASHQFFAAMNYRAQLHVEAMKEAYSEGLTGDAFGERVNYIKGHPEEFSSINDAARKYGEQQAFLADLGKTGKKVQELSNSSLFTKMVVPFIKIPLNMFKYSWERTPGLNMISSKFWSDISEGGPAAEQALAKTSTGIMAIASIAYLANQGKITGNGPENPNLRKIWLQDHQPYAVKIGDRWVSFRNLEPLSKIMGMTADVTSLIEEHEIDRITGYMSAAALSVSQLVMTQPYMQGLSNLLNAIKSTGTLSQRAEQYVENYAASMVPAGVKQVNKVYLDRVMREVNSIGDALKASIPGLSKDLPPKRGFWGQEIVPEGSFGPDMLSPYKQTIPSGDPVTEEIVRNKIPLSMPPKVLGGVKPSEDPMRGNDPSANWGIKLQPKEYDRLVVLARSEIESGGKTLHEKLADVINSPSYQMQSDGPDGGKALLIRSYIHQYELLAQRQLLKEFPDLSDKIQQQKMMKIQALKPTL